MYATAGRNEEDTTKVHDGFCNMWKVINKANIFKILLLLI